VSSVLVDDARYLRSALLGRLRQEDSGATRAVGPTGTVWIQVLGANGIYDGDGNVSKISRTTSGAIAGLDLGFGERWRAGFAAGFSDGDIDIRNLASTADVFSSHIAAYLGADFGAINVRTGAGYTWTRIRSARAVQFPGVSEVENADYSARTGQIFAEVGYNVPLGTATLEPFAGLAYVDFDRSRFDERGGIGTLSVATYEKGAAVTTLGARLKTSLTVGASSLTPHVSLAWQHAGGFGVPFAVQTFQNTGTAFAVSGVAVTRNAALVDAGIDWQVSERARIGVSYAGMLASHARDHALRGVFAWTF
jgi:outer membrane autotransporter protein